MTQHPDDDEKFDEWVRILEDVIQGKYGYESGEFTVYPSLWRPLYDEGLTPEQAWQRAMDGFANARRERDAEKAANYARIVAAHANSVKLLEATQAVSDDVCSLLCPSQWKEADGRPPHHPKCVALQNAISAALAAGPAMVYCVRCIDGGGDDQVHIFSTEAKAKAFAEDDSRDHVLYDYVIDHPERMEQAAQ